VTECNRSGARLQRGCVDSGGSQVAWSILESVTTTNPVVPSKRRVAVRMRSQPTQEQTLGRAKGTTIRSQRGKKNGEVMATSPPHFLCARGEPNSVKKTADESYHEHPRERRKNIPMQSMASVNGLSGCAGEEGRHEAPRNLNPGMLALEGHHEKRGGDGHPCWSCAPGTAEGMERRGSGNLNKPEQRKGGHSAVLPVSARLRSCEGEIVSPQREAIEGKGRRGGPIECQLGVVASGHTSRSDRHLPE
jgi:hypothetical protein